MIEKDIRDLRVKDVFDILAGEPAMVKEDALLKDAVEAITQHLTSQKVYVVDHEEKLKGVITIETLLSQVGYIVGVRKKGMVSFFKFLSGILKENVLEFMDKPVSVTKSDRVLDAMRLMVEHHLNDLPIVDEKKMIIGELRSIEILKHAKKIFNEA